MSGYRQSSYDPNAGGDYGPPLRPYNWVQWTGVAIGFLGIAGILLYFADRLGWIDVGLKEPGGFIALPMIGAMLVNSRRAPGTQITPEVRRKRILILLAVALAAAIVGAAIAIYLNSKGAH